MEAAANAALEAAGCSNFEDELHEIVDELKDEMNVLKNEISDLKDEISGCNEESLTDEWNNKKIQTLVKLKDDSFNNTFAHFACFPSSDEIKYRQIHLPFCSANSYKIKYHFLRLSFS